jgi:8-amino-3,8-dideoxy-alpha-D-manno-octulosonate transaminase
MPGYELIGPEERNAILEWFDASNGVMFAHGFDKRRNGVFKVREFERSVAKTVGAKHALATSSGSASLLVALRAIGIGSGDEVITQAFTFVATVEAILETGATPIIVEVDRSLNMNPDQLKASITPRTKAVIPVHMAGAAADMDRIVSIAREHRLAVLEDSAQAFGGTYKGRYLGTLGDAGIYSFDFGKNITTGEGGMIVTNDSALFERARAYHDHGHEYNPAVPRGKDSRSKPGFNFRMTEMQAVIGLTQLKKLPSIIGGQRSNKAAVKNGIKDCGFEFRRLHDKEGDIGDTVIFFLDSETQALRMAEELGRKNLGTKNLPDALDWHFAGTWRHIFHRLSCTTATATGSDKAGCACHFDVNRCACAGLLRRAVALPVNVKMTPDEIQFMVQSVRSIAEDLRKAV